MIFKLYNLNLNYYLIWIKKYQYNHSISLIPLDIYYILTFLFVYKYQKMFVLILLYYFQNSF